MTSSSDSTGTPGVMYLLLRRMIDVQPEEVRELGWSWLYFFAVMSAYYVIRPIRDEMGIAGGVNNLPWLFTGTLVGMMVANPLYSAIVSRMPRVKFVAFTYHFFIANLLIFFLLLKASSGADNIWVGRFFYIWTAIFNLFVVSVFWSFITDVFTRAQGIRLFGFIAAGGTLGGIMGSSLTDRLVHLIGPTYLLFISMALLEIAVLSVRKLSKSSERLRATHHQPPQAEKVIGGGVLSGISNALRSPYLLNVSLYMLLYTILSTFLYFQQATLVSDAHLERVARTALFARIDLIVNVLTLAMQLMVSGRVLKTLGVAITLTLIPAVTAGGFLALGLVPVLAVVVWFQTVRRAGNYAFSQPARQVLFTVLPREDRYKAKSFIDTFIYRAGDQIGAWSYALMAWLHLGVVGISFVAVPLSLLWLLNGFWLGRRQEKLAAAGAGSAPLKSVEVAG